MYRCDACNALDPNSRKRSRLRAALGFNDRHKALQQPVSAREISSGDAAIPTHPVYRGAGRGLRSRSREACCNRSAYRRLGSSPAICGGKKIRSRYRMLARISPCWRSALRHDLVLMPTHLRAANAVKYCGAIGQRVDRFMGPRHQAVARLPRKGLLARRPSRCPPEWAEVRQSCRSIFMGIQSTWTRS